MTAPVIFDVEFDVRVPTVDVEVQAPIVSVEIPGDPTIVIAALPGPPGPRGPGGTGSQIVGETPTGVKNGTNTVFTVAQPYQTGSVAVHRNGLREHLSIGYSETTTTQITFTTAPMSDDDILVDYLAQ